MVIVCRCIIRATHAVRCGIIHMMHNSPESGDRAKENQHIPKEWRAAEHTHTELSLIVVVALMRALR